MSDIDPLVIPTESLDEGPIRDCFEILRQWVSDLAVDTVSTADVASAISGSGGSSDSFSALGMSLAHFEGTILSSTLTLTLSTPGNKDITGWFGVSSIAGLNTLRAPIYPHAVDGSRLRLDQGSSADQMVLANFTGQDMYYSVFLVYRT